MTQILGEGGTAPELQLQPRRGKKVKGMAKPNSKAPLGAGGRFAAVEASARKSGASNPAAVAAAIGRAKYGNKKMASMAAKGRKAAK